MAEKLIRQALAESSTKNKNILKFLNFTKEEIRLDEMKFGHLLKTRKEECMSQYANYLDKQEELLKQEYVTMCNNHISQYNDQTALQYHEEKLRKLAAEVVLQKDEILATVHDIENKSLSREVLSLSKDFNFLSERPLGSFEVVAGENVLVSGAPLSTMSTNADEIRKESSNTVTAITKSPSAKRVQPFFDVKIGDKRVGRIICNLYEDIVPITCRNFIGLCKGGKGWYGYKRSEIDCVFPGKCCYGGCINFGNGETENKSFYGELFKCENHIKKHDKRGLLSMVNNGGRGHHGSAFLITFDAQPQFDGHHVVFGDITDGSYRVLKEIENVTSSGRYGRPSKKIVFLNCGMVSS